MNYELRIWNYEYCSSAEYPQLHTKKAFIDIKKTAYFFYFWAVVCFGFSN